MSMCSHGNYGTCIDCLQTEARYKSKDERVTPFSNGDEFGSWDSANCAKCKKGYVNNGDKYVCELDEAVGLAYVGDGKITTEQAKRIGRESGDRQWRCTEFGKHEVDKIVDTLFETN